MESDGHVPGCGPAKEGVSRPGRCRGSYSGRHLQGFIDNAMTLVVVGNSFLRGTDISAFWPNAPTFRFMKYCEFRQPAASGEGEGEFQRVTADPNSWLTEIKRAGRRGLRLHHAPRPRQPTQSLDTPDRMLVGFLGGGPRWLIGVIGDSQRELWEGSQSLLDRNDPDRRIWGATYMRVGKVDPGSLQPVLLADALSELRRVLPEIEAYANQTGQKNFGQCFADAQAALDHGGAMLASPPEQDGRWTGIGLEHEALRRAIDHAWVFGGIGSWNDIGGSGERYDALSQRLFEAPNNAVCGLANAGCAPLAG